jgi:hypothetical protein
MSGDDNTTDKCEPFPRALREEFDGIKPHKRKAYETPAQRSEHARQASLTRWTRFREEDELDRDDPE